MITSALKALSSILRFGIFWKIGEQYLHFITWIHKPMLRIQTFPLQHHAFILKILFWKYLLYCRSMQKVWVGIITPPL